MALAAAADWEPVLRRQRAQQQREWARSSSGSGRAIGQGADLAAPLAQLARERDGTRLGTAARQAGAANWAALVSTPLRASQPDAHTCPAADELRLATAVGPALRGSARHTHNTQPAPAGPPVQQDDGATLSAHALDPRHLGTKLLVNHLLALRGWGGDVAPVAVLMQATMQGSCSVQEPPSSQPPGRPEPGTHDGAP